jgi:hypothetical protein
MMGPCAAAADGSKAGGLMVVTAASPPAGLGGGLLLPFREDGNAVGAKGTAGGWLGGARRWPHVTQNRKLRGLRWPHSGHGDGSDALASAAAAPDPASPSRCVAPTKLTSGAGGRCGTSDGGRGGCDARGSTTGAEGPLGERPMTGVAGTARAASR